MKIRYVSHLLENSGYGRACRDIALALYRAGADLVINPVVLGKLSQGVLTGQYEVLRPLIDKPSRNTDYLLQFVLPHYFQYNGRYKKCAGYALFETLNYTHTKMYEYCKLMDEIYSPVKVGENSKSVFLPLDTSFVNKSPKMRIPELDYTYKFYTVCDYSRRKNLWGMVRAFLLAFNEADNASFIIKISSPEYSPSDFKAKLENELLVCMENCGTKGRRNIHFITERFTEEQIYALHNSCDCFVSASFGEGWNYPMFDAMAFGNPVLSTDTPVVFDITNNNEASITVLHSYKDIYHGETDRLPGYHTFRENVLYVNEEYLADDMYKEYKSGSRKVDNSLFLEKITFEKIGEQLCEHLEE